MKNVDRNENTSVCLIYFPESTADSKKSLRGINIPNTISKSFNRAPIILKFFRSEISMVMEISIDFNLLGIVEFQIYHFILPILQANLGKKNGKNPFKTCNIQKLNVSQKVLKLDGKFSTFTHNPTRFLNPCLVHHRFHRTNPDLGF